MKIILIFIYNAEISENVSKLYKFLSLFTVSEKTSLKGTSVMNPQFYILPKALFESPYKKLSPNAKLLYSLLLDRFSLSEKTKFTDDDGALTVIFTNDEVCEKLDCSHTSATKLFIELEKFGLIQRKRQGRGKPILIFVKRIIHSKILQSRPQKIRLQDCRNLAVKTARMLHLSILTKIRLTKVRLIHLSSMMRLRME